MYVYMYVQYTHIESKLDTCFNGLKLKEFWKGKTLTESLISFLQPHLRERFCIPKLEPLKQKKKTTNIKKDFRLSQSLVKQTGNKKKKTWKQTLEAEDDNVLPWELADQKGEEDWIENLVERTERRKRNRTKDPPFVTK